MKLLRYGPRGSEKPGIIDTDGNVRDLSGVVDDIAGETLSNEKLTELAALDLSKLPLVEKVERLGSCVSGTGKFICIGLNYADHAAESGMDVPSEPVIFMKATSAICGPNDPVIIPRNSEKTDWEVELGVVIGKRAKYVSEENAMDYVAGWNRGGRIYPTSPNAPMWSAKSLVFWPIVPPELRQRKQLAPISTTY